MSTLHIRRQIRDAVVNALKGRATTGNDVFAGRTWPMPKELKACLLVYMEGGPSLLDAMGGSDTGHGLLRNERLVIEARVRTTGAEPEDLLLTIAAEVEPVMMSDSALGALVLARELINTEITAHAEGDDRQGEMKLTYSLPVRTSTGDPTANI